MIELNFPEPVTSEGGFFDRQREWIKIEQAFRARDTRSVIILGERRIGKTSLQTVTAKRLEMDESLNIVPLFLPFGPLMRSIHDLAREILQALCIRLGRNPQETKLVDADEGFRLPSIGQFWQEIEQLLVETSGQTFLICIDEFDALLKNCTRSDQKDVLNLLQDLIERRTTLPLKLFLSATTLEFSGIDIHESPLVSKSDVIELECFGHDDVDTMVQTLLIPGADVRREAVARLFYLSGGHPYVTKLLMDHLLEPYGYEAHGLVIDVGTVEGAAAKATDDPRARSALTNLYDVHFDDEQKGLLLLLADPERQHGVTKKELHVMGTNYITAAESLERRGYLTKIKDTTDSTHDLYRLHIAFLGLWLYHWERYEAEVERRLRDVQRRLRRIERPWEGVEPTIVTEDDLRKFGLRP